MATVLDLTGAPYPQMYHGNRIFPHQGRSFLPALYDPVYDGGPRYWHWAHDGQRGVWNDPWKAVFLDRRHPVPQQDFPESMDGWHLYDLSRNRSEAIDHKDSESERLEAMIQSWKNWASSVGWEPSGRWSDDIPVDNGFRGTDGKTLETPIDLPGATGVPSRATLTLNWPEIVQLEFKSTLDQGKPMIDNLKIAPASNVYRSRATVLPTQILDFADTSGIDYTTSLTTMDTTGVSWTLTGIRSGRVAGSTEEEETALVVEFDGDEYRLARADSEPFDVISLDVANLSSSPLAYTLIGTKNDRTSERAEPESFQRYFPLANNASRMDLIQTFSFDAPVSGMRSLIFEAVNPSNAAFTLTVYGATALPTIPESADDDPFNMPDEFDIPSLGTPLETFELGGEMFDWSVFEQAIDFADGNYFWVTLVVELGDVNQEIDATRFAPLSYDAYARYFFSEAELGDPSISGPDGSADGITTNRFRFFFGENPRSGKASRNVEVARIDDNYEIALEVPPYVEPLSGFSWFIADNLNSWNPTTPLWYGTSRGADGKEKLRIRFEGDDSASQFFRMESN